MQTSGSAAVTQRSAIATKALTDVKAATSVDVAGTVTDSGQTLTFDLTLVSGKGCQGTLTESKTGSFKLIYLGKKVWIMPDQAFYKSNGGNDPATLAILSGKWMEVKAGAGGIGSLSTMCTLSSLLGGFSSDSPSGMIKGATATINGQRAVKLTDTGDPAYVYVSDTATPELTRLYDPSSGGGTIDLTNYNAPASISTPPASKVLDGSKYGF
jgi:hypothetical protein